jgi:hypothetical protein
LLALVCLSLVVVAGCSDQPEPAAPGPGTATAPPEPSGGRTLPIPGTGGSASTPRSESAGPLVWDVPDGWVAEKPSSNMRLAQYRVSGPGGDAECIVFYFGPGQGGDPSSNAARWAGQFTQPDGSDPVAAMEFGPLEGAQVPVHLVEVTGTYDGGMSGPMDVAGYMLLGGIAQGADAPWFFKFIGPEATVRAERDAFVGMMKSLRADG